MTYDTLRAHEHGLAIVYSDKDLHSSFACHIKQSCNSENYTKNLQIPHSLHNDYNNYLLSIIVLQCGIRIIPPSPLLPVFHLALIRSERWPH